MPGGELSAVRRHPAQHRPQTTPGNVFPPFVSRKQTKGDGAQGDRQSHFPRFRNDGLGNQLIR
jgi:hypothetical protein